MDKAAYVAMLAPIVDEYRQHGYEFWESLVDSAPRIHDVVAPDGSQCCIEVNALRDHPSKDWIRVMFSIDDGGWCAFAPVNQSFIIAADGTFIGE